MQRFTDNNCLLIVIVGGTSSSHFMAAYEYCLRRRYFSPFCIPISPIYRPHPPIFASVDLFLPLDLKQKQIHLMLHQINIYTHIIAGSLALVIGLIPFFTKKGSSIHQRYGRYFLYLMGVTILTATLGVLFFRSRPFLTIVTLQSAYMSFAGYRILKTKTKGPERIDLIATLFLVTMAGRFLFLIGTRGAVWHQSVVVYLLGFLFAVAAYDILRHFKPQLAKYWLLEHIFKMTSAYIALFSAFAGTVLSAWQPYSQIIPSAMGTVWIISTIWYYSRKKLGA